MRIWMLAAGAAALAITAPALADPKGGGGKDRGQSAKVERGGGQAKAQRGGNDRGGGQARAQRGGDRDRGSAFRFAQSENRGGQKADRGRDRGERAVRAQGGGDNRGALRAARVDDRGNRDNRGNRAFRDAQRDERRAARAVQVEDRGNRGRGNDAARVLRVDNDNRGNGRFADSDRVFKVRDLDRGVVRVRDIDRDELFARRVGWVDGCPPGLAKKNLDCLPPGQAKKFIGQPLMAASRIAALDPLPTSLRSLYFDDDDYYYRYGGGYLYRVDRDDDLISSMVPLFGAALLGQPLQPSYINSYYRPSYYSAFYPNSPYDCYQYGYGYVYETDCMSGLVEDVIPTYDYGYGVGQLLPTSYGYYNVPYAYRSYYADNDDYYYRYAPGAIYQVDRSTSLISAVAALLTGGLTVGQPLPVGYSAYNVPYAYRTTYMDTPDMWYRYNNGYIYSVDPTTQLVTAVVRALV